MPVTLAPNRGSSRQSPFDCDGILATTIPDLEGDPVRDRDPKDSLRDRQEDLGQELLLADVDR